MPGKESPALWTDETACGAVSGRLHGPRPWQVSDIQIDSRAVKPGDLFVALTGGARDGHFFVADALVQGAEAALICELPAGVAGDARLLEVPDTLEALGDLGKARRAAVSARICAITGSVGKTGTKEMLNLCLSASGRTHSPVKSFNNHIGVPLTLARMPVDTQYGVFEIGMNHAGEITPLTQMVRPHVAIITTIAPVHIEFFDSLDGIAEAKAEILFGLEPGGTAILNRDNEYFGFLADRARERGAERIVGFGENEGAEARLLESSGDETGSDVVADILGTRLTYRLAMPGEHVVRNSLAVLAAVAALEADLEAAAQALARTKAPEGRGQRHRIALPDGSSMTVIDESYNANPASMAAGLKALGQTAQGPGGRRIAVLGDMLELGDGSPAYHEALAQDIEAAAVDLVFCSGPLMQHLWNVLPESRRGAYAPTSTELRDKVMQATQAGDVVMVKGSLGSAMRPIVDELLAKHGDEAQGPDGDRKLGAIGGLKAPC